MRLTRAKNVWLYLDSLHHLFVSGFKAIGATQGVVRPDAALPMKLAVAGLTTAVRWSA